ADSGRSWRRAGLERTQAIARIRVHPSNSDVVFVAAFGNPYGPNADRGIFRSTDGGTSWTKVLYRNATTGASDLVFDPKDPQVVYAALWEAFRTPYSLSDGGPGSGLFKSTDGGTTWKELTKNPGLPQSEVLGKVTIAVAGGDSRRLYAMVEAKDCGLFRSDDGGATWTRVNRERRLWQRAFYFIRMTADPVDPDAICMLWAAGRVAMSRQTRRTLTSFSRAASADISRGSTDLRIRRASSTCGPSIPSDRRRAI